MSDVVLIGAEVEAEGHPSSCTEPAPGTVEGSSPLTVDGVGVYDKDNADIQIPTHAHEFILACVSKSEHTIDPDGTNPLSIDGNTVYVESDTGTDPDSGGTVSFADDGGNDVLSIS